MLAEFRSESMSALPRLFVLAETEIEWRALQMFIKLMEYGKTGVTAEYTPKSDEESD